MSSQKLQSVQLKMFAEILRVLELHQIKYFLLGGSALGAVRHQGFIPWDDDIDIGIPRGDYEKFLAVAQHELANGYFLQTWDSDPDYPLPFAKVRDSNTTFVERSVAHLGINHGIYIDVFPLDGYSDNEMANWWRVRCFRTLKAALLYRFKIRRRLAFLHPFIFALGTFAPSNWLKRRLERVMKSLEYDKSDRIINWNGAWGLKEALPRSIFGEGCHLQFEGRTAMVPVNFKGYLSALYGDFMQPPPPDKRISDHQTEFLDVDRPYTDYVQKQQDAIS
jgi:lipopolysaccharide cholinephosphotransferase